MSDETYLESPDDHLDSGLIVPRVRLLLHGLSDRNVLKHCWCYFPKMQTDDALFFKQFDLYTALPGHVRLHPASANLTVIPDAPVRQSMDCHVLPFLPCTEPNAPPALPSDAMENEPACHVERGTWDLLVVRVMSEWMRDDAYSEAFVGPSLMSFTKFQFLLPEMSLKESALFFGLSCLKFVLTDSCVTVRKNRLSLLFK